MKPSLALGILSLLFSELVFVMSNYLIHVGLGRYLGPATYGIFGVIMSLYLINRAFLNTGIPRTVSKFASEVPDKMAAIFQTAFVLQLILAVGLGSIYILFSRQISVLLYDLSLQEYIVFLGATVVPLSFLSLSTNGFMNGMRLFTVQAFVKTFYPLFRVLLTFLFVFAGFGLLGVLWGYQLAVIAGLILTWFFLRKERNVPSFLQWELLITTLFIMVFLWYHYFHNLWIMVVVVMVMVGLSIIFAHRTKTLFSLKKIVSFSIPIALASLAFALLRNVNILLIKVFIKDNIQVGWYTAAYTISTIPYLVFMAFPLALTPSVSRAAAAGNFSLIQKYTSQSLRYALLLVVPVTVLIAASSEQFILFFYSSAYSNAAPLLGVLIIGSAFLSVFSTLSSVSTGSGRPTVEMFLCLFFLLLLGLLNWYLIPRWGLLGSAYAVLVTSVIATAAIGLYIYRHYGCFLSWRSFLRIMLVASIIYYITLLWNAGGFTLLVMYVVLSILFYLLLYLLGELQPADFALIKKIYYSNKWKKGYVNSESNS